MITKCFAIYDTKAGMFHVPFFFPHMGQAIRAVVDLGSDLSTVIGRHPNDFALYELGHFDDATGVVTAIPPQNLGMVSSFLPSRTAPLPGLHEYAQEAASISRPNGQADA